MRADPHAGHVRAEHLIEKRGDAALAARPGHADAEQVRAQPGI